MAVPDDAPTSLPPDGLDEFETNAALQRLEIASHVTRLTEDRAVGGVTVSSQERARLALDSVTGELERLKAFGRERAPLPPETVLRMVEIGLMLESARRSLSKALEPADSSLE
jgi:hypothetical protein